MSAFIIDGKLIAHRIQQDLKTRVNQLKYHNLYPRLDVILVGDHPPSKIYVKYKKKVATQIGIDVHIHRFSEQIDRVQLIEKIQALNENSQIHGILIQLPLPSHFSSNDTWKIVETVDPKKDVDGLHPLNQGSIGLSSQQFVACTPLGCLTLLQDTLMRLEDNQQKQGQQKQRLQGKKIVIVGRSRIVGRPLSLLLTSVHATTTLCHSKTLNLKEEIQQADVVVAAAGSPHLIKGDWIKSKAIVIDVGIHRLSKGHLCGDVEFDMARKKARAITPVPGGVGPMTIISLMNNVCFATEMRATHQVDDQI